jgi:DNA topoisomerase IB
VTGGASTAKEFRTWRASVIAAVDEVTAVLGDARAVCRVSYIHADVLKRFASGTLDDIDSRKTGRSAADAPLLDTDERVLLA